MSEVDDARWALYYGVKQLAKSSVPGSGSFEAKLFYNFLDERYGEDELTFFLYWCVPRHDVEGIVSMPSVMDVGWQRVVPVVLLRWVVVRSSEPPLRPW